MRILSMKHFLRKYVFVYRVWTEEIHLIRNPKISHLIFHEGMFLFGFIRIWHKSINR